MCNAVAEVSHKPRSLQPGFSVITSRFEGVMMIRMSTVHLWRKYLLRAFEKEESRVLLYEFEFKNDPREWF